MYATCAKLFNYPDAPRRGGRARDPGGGEDVHRLPRRTDVHLRPPEDVPLPHGRAGDGAELRRRLQPRRQPEARSRRRSSYMREIVGADAVIGGRAKTISGVRALGRYRLQIRLTRPVGDLTARLTMPFFCPILPEYAVDPTGNRRPGRLRALLRRRARRQPAHRPEAQPVLPRQPPGERRRDRVDLRHEPGELPGSHRGEPDRPLRGVRDPRDGVPATGQHVRRQPTGRALLRQPRGSTCGTSPSTTSGRPSWAQGRSRSRRRSTTRSTGGRSARHSATWAARLTTSCCQPRSDGTRPSTLSRAT